MTKLSGLQALKDQDLIGMLRTGIVPEFMSHANIGDLKSRGFRMVIDIFSYNEPAEINLIAGSDAVRVPNVNPQDWLVPGCESWDPDSPAPFFEACSDAARQGLERMRFGNRIILTDPSRGVFAVEDGDPKATTHHLMMKTLSAGTMIDPNFTERDWLGFFSGAVEIIRRHEATSQAARLVANFGNHFQQGPQVHMHVMTKMGFFPEMFPQHYGFNVLTNGVIEAVPGNLTQERVVRLIVERGNIKGFTPDAMAARKTIDHELFDLLR
jgi:hypothetical protein